LGDAGAGRTLRDNSNQDARTGADGRTSTPRSDGRTSPPRSDRRTLGSGAAPSNGGAADGDFHRYSGAADRLTRVRGTDRDGYPYGDLDGNADGHAHTHTDVDININFDSDLDAYRDGDTDRGADADADQ
jgi:hypothetical protein